ncbi:MAG: beta-Ala-His dipeptidase [Eubacterium sp.]|nr:beta-Ala-His dipeptidase [Eubacterium sp.]
MSCNHLEQLEPVEVFHYFAEIADIPRPSGSEQAISDYLVRFARQHNLEHYQDRLHNVIIIKEATSGYENVPPVILQGHMDMVCEKEPDCQIDMEKEGLKLRIDGDYLSAEGTTLGGDDGIAIAYALAILASSSLQHPRIEFVCTVSEETGMEGASGIDVSMLRGRRMINLDSEAEKEMMCGCAGGGRTIVTLPVCYETAAAEGQILMTVSVTGLTGGHSGTEINKGRANAVILLAETLHELMEQYGAENIRLTGFGGGNKDNAIPREASAGIAVSGTGAEQIQEACTKAAAKFREKYGKTDPGLAVTVSAAVSGNAGAVDVPGNAGAADCKKEQIRVFKAHTAEKLLKMILTLPNGVQAMSADIPDLVETSLNLGIAITEPAEHTNFENVDTDQADAGKADAGSADADRAGSGNAVTDSVVRLHYSLRSSVAESYEKLAQNVARTAESFGACTSRQGEYPAWEYRKDSELRALMMPVYEEVFGRKPEITVIHAGVECGLLADKLPGLDAVSIGPDMLDIHTTEERLSVSSAARMYRYVVRVLEQMK